MRSTPLRQLVRTRIALALVLTLMVGIFISSVSTPQPVNATAEAIPGSTADALRLAVGAGNFHSCVIDSNNGVKCSGSSTTYTNAFGQLGQGNSTYPGSGAYTVSGLSSGVKQIAVGNVHSCALLAADGSVKCWGRNYNGSIGDGRATTAGDALTPANVITTSNANLTGVSDIASFDDHTCAVKSGAVLCWGYNIGGMGISGNTSDTLLKATQVLASGAVSVAVGSDSSCALMSDATVKCWGTGTNGQMGNSGSSSYNHPATTVAGLSNVAALSVGQGTACALKTNGEIYCWGNNLFGVVANGNCGGGTNAAVPAGPVNSFIGVTANENVVAISLSYSNGIALTDTGRSIYWGGNASSPCRGGSTWQSPSGGLTVVGISASQTGLGQSCYVRSDGAVFCSGAAISGVTPAGANAPDAPGKPTVTVGDGQATITITPPTTGGTPSSYTVTANPGSATCTVTSPATSCTINGLTNGTAYTFTSTATNTFGTSNASIASDPATPIAVPGVPGKPTVTVGDGQATITITPPTTGGTPSSYTVTANPGGATCTVTSPATSCTINGLTNGTAYAFTSTATNAAGTSSASVSSDSATPVAPPSTPGKPTITIGDSKATITITPPTTGGTPSSYTITANPGGATCTVTSPATSCTINGLTNGTAYTFTSTATNAAGTSSASVSSDSTTPVAPPTSSGKLTSASGSSGTSGNTTNESASASKNTTRAGNSSLPQSGSTSTVYELAFQLILLGAILLISLSASRHIAENLKY